MFAQSVYAVPYRLFAVLVFSLLITHCANDREPSGLDTSDGSTDPTSELCQDTDFIEINAPVNIMFLQDISGSMNDSSKWQQATEALTTILSEWTGPEFRFGYDLFPPIVANTYSPDPAAYCDTTPAQPYGGSSGVTIDCDRFQQQPILELQQQITPYGGTPLWCAMENFNDEAYAPSLLDSAFPTYLVVISDGEDTCDKSCSGGFIDTDTDSAPPAEPITTDDLEEITTELRIEMELKTFVIGFGYEVAEDELNAIAAAGGTAYRNYIEARDEPALINAFERILATVRGCRFSVDASQVSHDNERNAVYLGLDPLTHRPGCTSGRGWRFADSTQQEVVLCDESCVRFQNKPSMKASATFGCLPQLVE